MMQRIKRKVLLLCAAAACALAVPQLASAESIEVAYAGSMGVVMDRFLGPQFAAAHSVQYKGIGHGSYGLARLIQSRQMRPDVFISVTRGPVDLLVRAGLLTRAEPFASTAMVITYNPKGRFAKRFEQAAAGKLSWIRVLESGGLRFGRTDPATDPQGRNIVFTFLLAERYYKDPGAAKRILGAPANPAQIFTETSLLSRLEAGQLDASSAYRSSAVSHGLPFIMLPAEINLGDADYAKSWYSTVALTLDGPTGRPQTVSPEPLVFYAGVPVDARRPKLGRDFVAYLRTDAAQNLLKTYGYGPPSGPTLP